MHTGPLNLESLAARVEKLERQNRWLKRTGLAFIGVPVAIALMGQGKPATPKPTPARTAAPTMADELQNLTYQVNDLDTRMTNQVIELDSRVTKLETMTADRYQIAATTVIPVAGMPFSQVFIVDTLTGYVCQVVGENARQGEIVGTSLPYCTQRNTDATSPAPEPTPEQSPSPPPTPEQCHLYPLITRGCPPGAH